MSKKPDKKLIEQMVTVPRKWTSLPTLDWYVMREFLIKFSIIILVSAMLFILGDVFNDLSDFLDHDAPIVKMIRYFLLRLPGNLSFVLPISVLLGCMWTMAMFGKNLEVTAMRASGLSLMRCGRSIFVMGLLVTFVNIYFNEMLVPKYNLLAENAKREMTREPGTLEDYQKMLTFKSFDKQRVWLFRTFDNQGKYEDVTLKLYRPDNTMERYISAENATYDRKTGWKFTNVTETEYSRDGFMPKNPRSVPEMIISPENAPEDPVTIRNAVSDVNVLPCWTIWGVLMETENMAERASNIYWTVFFYRLAFPWASFIAVFLGVPLATKNERSGIMTAVITAVVIIVAYIVISETFKVLGRQGTLPPVIAGLAPTLAFIFYGYWNVRRDQI